MSKEQIFSKSLQANKDFVDSLTKEQLEEKMKPFDDYEVEQCDIHDVVLQSEQLCDNPHCEDGIVDRDMYGHPIYCQVCDSQN